MKLDDIRRKIDKIDRELLVLLQERMGLAIQAKKFKAKVADPQREEVVLARAERMNLALVESSFARQLLSTIIQESKRLQKENRKLVAFQGEHGAYGEVASRRLSPGMAFIPCLEFIDVFTGVQEGHFDLGVVPEAGSSLLAPLRIGAQRAFELLCLGEAFDAQRACQAGMVNQVVAADQLEAVAMKAATRLAMKPPGALAAARKLLRGDTSAILAQIERESELFAERLSSDEAKEAFSAFLEKRAPDFSRFRRSR